MLQKVAILVFVPIGAPVLPSSFNQAPAGLSNVSGRDVGYHLLQLFLGLQTAHIFSYTTAFLVKGCTKSASCVHGMHSILQQMLPSHML